MPAELDSQALLDDLAARGGKLADLQKLPKAELQPALKHLGFTKLGDRARVIAAIQAVPVELEPATSAAAPSGVYEVINSPLAVEAA